MELVKSVSIENLVNKRAALVKRLTEAKRLYDEATAIAVDIGIGSVPDLFFGQRGFTVEIRIRDSEYLDKVSRAVDSAVWDLLMKESGLLTFMNAETRKEWTNWIYSHKAPPLTPENVKSAFIDMHSRRGNMFEAGVVDAFKKLSWDYKTNNPCRFGKKIIMGCFGALGWNASYEKCNQLDDLERVFAVMDGKPEADHRDGWYKRLPQRVEVAESDYMTVKRFKNGNAHVTFKRPDLVEEMNKIIAKHYPGALPARV